MMRTKNDLPILLKATAHGAPGGRRHMQVRSLTEGERLAREDLKEQERAVKNCFQRWIGVPTRKTMAIFAAWGFEMGVAHERRRNQAERSR